MKNKKLTRNLLLVSAITVFIGMTAAVTAWKTDSGIKFSHKLHLDDVGAECKDCHTQLAPENKLMTWPTHKECGACHKDEIEKSSAKANCALCHTRKDNSVSDRQGKGYYSDIIYSHNTHQAKDLKCQECHTSVQTNTGVQGAELIPKMDDCVSCHKQKSVTKAQDCAGCHINDVSNLKPSSHTTNWLHQHGKTLIPNRIEIKEKCETCHNQKNGKDCRTCHMSQAPRNHTLAFKNRGHANQAMLNRESCTTCHNQDTCVTCHMKNPPMSHTAMWASPFDRHCNTCHLDGSNYAGSTGSAGNCSFCHRGSVIAAKHLTAPARPAGHQSSGCLDCHGWGTSRKPKHPIMSDTSNCLQCHK